MPAQGWDSLLEREHSTCGLLLAVCRICDALSMLAAQLQYIASQNYAVHDVTAADYLYLVRLYGP